MTEEEIQKIVREIRRASGRAEVLRIGQHVVLLERIKGTREKEIVRRREEER